MKILFYRPASFRVSERKGIEMQGIRQSFAENSYITGGSQKPLGHTQNQNDSYILLKKMMDLDRICTDRAGIAHDETNRLLQPYRSLLRNELENIEFKSNSNQNRVGLPEELILHVVEYCSDFTNEEIANVARAFLGRSRQIYGGRLQDLVISHAACIDDLESVKRAISVLNDPCFSPKFRSDFVENMLEERKSGPFFYQFSKVSGELFQAAKKWSSPERRDVIKSCLTPFWVRYKIYSHVHAQAKMESETLTLEDKKSVDAFMNMTEVVHPKFADTFLEIDEDKRADRLIESLGCLSELSERTTDRWQVTNAVCENMIHLPLSDSGEALERVARSIVDVQSVLPKVNRNTNLMQIGNSLNYIQENYGDNVDQVLQKTFNILVDERNKMIEKTKKLNNEYKKTTTEMDEKIDSFTSVHQKDMFYQSSGYKSYHSKIKEIERIIFKDTAIIGQLSCRLGQPHTPLS